MVSHPWYTLLSHVQCAVIWVSLCYCARSYLALLLHTTCCPTLEWVAQSFSARNSQNKLNLIIGNYSTSTRILDNIGQCKTDFKASLKLWIDFIVIMIPAFNSWYWVQSDINPVQRFQDLLDQTFDDFDKSWNSRTSTCQTMESVWYS